MEQALFLKKEQHQLKNGLQFNFCGFSKSLPFHSFGPAIRQQYILHIVMEGKGTYQVKNQQFHLKKGDLFLIRPGDSTFYLADGEDPWMYCWLSFSGADAAELVSHSLFKEDQYTMVSSDIQKYIEVILACFPYAAETIENEVHLSELAYRFLGVLLVDGGKIQVGEQKNYSPLAVEAVEYIDAHYGEALTVEGIAQHLAINRSHLSRVFRNHMAISLKEYILGVRINRGAFLLSQTDRSVEQIAEEVGFNSLVVFSRMFKKMTGETATAYRKRMKNDEFTNVSLNELKKRLKQQAFVNRAT